MLWHLFWGTSYERSGDVQIRVDCGQCGRSQVPSIAFDQTEKLMLFHCIPILCWHNTFVTCGNCGCKLTLSLRCEDLRRSHEGDLRHFISYNESIVLKFLTIVSLLCFIFPILGTILAAITLYVARKSTTWVRKVAVVAFVLSLLPSLFLIGGLLMGFR